MQNRTSGLLTALGWQGLMSCVLILSDIPSLRLQIRISRPITALTLRVQVTYVLIVSALPIYSPGLSIIYMSIPILLRFQTCRRYPGHRDNN